jgi:hypothetical protein
MKPETKARRERMKKQVDTARKEIEASESMTKSEKKISFEEALEELA